MSDQSNFDPQAFLQSTYTESNSTVSIPVPAGEHLAVITEVEARRWVKKDDPTKSGLALDIIYDIDSPAIKELLGRDRVTVKQGIMLDLTPSGSLDFGKGKNVTLGRLREATGLNQPGMPFSFALLKGRPLKILVGHRVDGDQIYSDVKGTAKVA